MIRRGFWILVGAAAGVAGYRRAARLAHSFLPRSSGELALRSPAPPAGRRLLAGAARAGRGAAASAAFVRDVRDGVAEYLDHQDPTHQDTTHPGAGRTLGSQQGRASRGRPAS